MEKVGEAMLSAMAQQLVTVLDEEVKHAVLFKHHFESMKTRLKSIESLLGKNYNQPIVQTYLSRIRDLMYEADDILTDCLIKEEYQNPFRTSFPFVFFFRLQTGKKIEDVIVQMEEMEGTISRHLATPGGSSSSSGNHELGGVEWSTRITAQSFEESDIIGRKKDVDDIKGLINKPSSKLQKIVIYGMGGLGKTTIAKKIFHDTDVRATFDQKIWVSVSQIFTVPKILMSILQQAGERVPEIESEMLTSVCELMKKKKCLIILDDIWEKGIEWWKKFLCDDLPNLTCKGSCIIITTRNKEVASEVGVDEENTHKPDGLNEIESWSLFSSKAFCKIDLEKISHEKFEQEGKNIVVECKGLPLAIKTIGALLGSTSSLNQWKKICEKFCEPNITKENQAVMTSLQLSYKALPPHLKLCLLSFSVFPEDVEIQAEKLINWWVAEGLIQGTASESASELGYEHLSNLTDRCLVDVADWQGFNGRINRCKMHDLVRDLTLAMANNETICSFDGDGRQELKPDSRWLGCTIETKADSLNTSPKLRAILLTSSDQLFSSRNLCPLLSLRALDLSDGNLDKHCIKNLLSWICSLKRLAYLNLRGATGLEEIPKSIRKLRNLQVLILSGCINLSNVNTSITCLKKLIILDLSSCDKLQYLPRGIGNLCQLQQLSGLTLVSQATRGSCQLVELGKLSKLRELRIRLCKESADIEEEQWNVLSNLKKLKVLAIDFGKCNDGSMLKMLNKFSPPSGIKEMHIRNYHYTVLPQQFTPHKLPNLAYLCIEESLLENICSGSTETTWVIERMCLNALPSLKADWKMVKKEMPLLKYAEVSCSFNLKNFPYPEHRDHKPVIWKP